MMRRLLTFIGIPALVLGAGGSLLASGIVPPALGMYLYPSLVALLFAALALAAFFFRMRPLLWPALAGVVGQLVGILLLALEYFEFWWEAVVFALVIVAIVVACSVAYWAVATLRARWLERRMIEGVGGKEGASQQEIKALREGMSEALRLLQRAGRGRQAIYMLPWFLVIGRPQAGKTVAIKNSGLGLPVRRDWVKGVGGTRTCDWFFTNDMIFLDTPGRWVVDGAEKQDRDYWSELLDLLRKHRGRRPLDGLVVVVPSEDLLGKSEKEIQEQAGKIREVVDLMQEKLGFRIPVYLLVSKADLVGGFVEFFRGLPAQRRHEILGWSHTDPNSGDPVELIHSGMTRIAKRLEAYRLEMIARVGSRTRARRLFFFPEEFKRLRESLMSFAEVFFLQDRYHEAPVFRGFYFTSGTQGEGSPLSRAMSDLAGQIGVSAPAVTHEKDDEPKRSYFLLELFRNLLVGDEGLIGRTAGHWLRRRRGTMFGAFLPAGVALGFFLLCFGGLLANRSLAARAGERLPRIAERLDEIARAGDPEQIGDALDLTGELYRLHRSMTGFTMVRGYGMRRGLRRDEGVADITLNLLRTRFDQAALRPTLVEAQRFCAATDEGAGVVRSCTDRMEVLRSVVWLRMARRAQWDEDLAGLDLVWQLPPERALKARQSLLRQYRYIADRSEEKGTKLPGFRLERAARAIRSDCGTLGSGSALEKYRVFQTNCSQGIVRQSDVQRCYGLLEDALTHQEQDYAAFARKFEELKSDLDQLQDDETEAGLALAELEQIATSEPERNVCLSRFREGLVPEIERYASQPNLVEECRVAISAFGNRAEKIREVAAVLKDQDEQLADQESKLHEAMRSYANECKGRMLAGMETLDFPTLKNIARNYRRVSCFPLDEPKPVQRRAERRVASNLRYFSRGSGVSRDYDAIAWGSRRRDWVARAEAAATMDAETRRYEEERIRSEVRAYARSYASSWGRYLDGLGQPPKKPTAKWLSGLAEARDEYERVLRPAVDALRAANDAVEPYLSPMQDELARLGGIAPFLDSKLSEYLGLLGEIAGDLEKCREDPAFSRGYRAAVLGARDQDATLVRAESWVAREAGQGLAAGRLRDLLQSPLDVARQQVLGGDQLQFEWGAMAELYARSLRGRFPFSGDPADEPAEMSDVVQLLGRQSGFVVDMKRVAAQGRLTAAGQAWVERADALSRILFAEQSDEPRRVVFQVEYSGYDVDPEKESKRVRLEKVVLYLGSDRAQLDWEEGRPTSDTLRLLLLGDESSETAYVQGFGAGRKPLLKRMMGKNWKEGEDKYFSKESGPWAPLRLLRSGLKGDSLSLEYTDQFEISSRRQANVTLRFELSGDEIRPLNRLAREGLDSPPPKGVKR